MVRSLADRTFQLRRLVRRQQARDGLRGRLKAGLTFAAVAKPTGAAEQRFPEPTGAAFALGERVLAKLEGEDGKPDWFPGTISKVRC